MTQYSILGRLKLMTELDEAAALAALPFCAAAMEQLLPQIKTECGNDPRLDQAGAAIAFCLLAQRAQSSDDDNIASFKAGDITVTKQGAFGKDRLAQAEQLRKTAMEDIQGLLCDTGFYAKDVAYKAAPPVHKRRRRHGQ